MDRLFNCFFQSKVTEQESLSTKTLIWYPEGPSSFIFEPLFRKYGVKKKLFSWKSNLQWKSEIWAIFHGRPLKYVLRLPPYHLMVVTHSDSYIPSYLSLGTLQNNLSFAFLWSLFRIFVVFSDSRKKHFQNVKQQISKTEPNFAFRRKWP